VPVAADTSGDEEDEEVMVEIEKKERRWANCHLSECDERKNKDRRVGRDGHKESKGMGNTTKPVPIT
jgi:hypothetical protein